MAFFTKNELTKKTAIKINSKDLRSDCLKCGLYKNCRTPKMDYSGKGKKKILILGEFSSDTEDVYGVQLSGLSGELLKEKLRALGIDMNMDCWKLNVVRCVPQEGKPIPTHKEIKCCYPHVEKTIKELKPKLVLLMGSLAVTSLFGKEFSDRSIERWRKYVIPDEKFRCHFIPLYHPNHLVKNSKDKNLDCLYDRDLKFAIGKLNKPIIPLINYEKYVKVLTDFKSVKNLLKKIIKRKPKLMFDYEGTGLKPYRIGHKITSIGIAISSKKAWTFPFNYKEHWTANEYKVLFNLWAKILADKKIKKMAHNFKFEDIWSREICGVQPDCFFDTMMAEHVLDNRSSSTGLKFQTFVNYGVRPYDLHIKPFLESKSGSEFNTIEDAPFKDILVYNGLDCIFAWMRYEEQIKKLTARRGLLSAYNFFMRGSEVMANIQTNGIATDSTYYKKANKKLTKRVKRLKKELCTGREARAFKRKYGREIKITSNQDIGKLAYTVLGKAEIRTDKGSLRTDKSTLESLDLPFVETLLEMKKWEKARGTYLAQFQREIVDEKMHPFFNLNIPVSYRGSCSGPNFQNLPKRVPEVGNLVRAGIVPYEKKDRLSEIDFSGAEVITSATYHLDKNFINYLVDKSTDMHRDNASDLWMLPHDMLINPKYNEKQKKLAKMVRFFAKNNWTFAQFYGDWFGSCGKMLWENCVESGQKLPNGWPIRKWLEKNGIYELGEVSQGQPTKGSFLEHCKKVEDKMWNVRFPEYTQWKKDIVEFYQKYGYIENHFGFRFVGYMDRKQCTNFPIQSASFHLLVYTLIEIQKFITKYKLKTRLIGQIHDSAIANVHHKELATYCEGVQEIVGNLQNVFKWLIIPMEIEIELSKTKEEGGNFSDMTEYSMKEIRRMAA